MVCGKARISGSVLSMCTLRIGGHCHLQVQVTQKDFFPAKKLQALSQRSVPFATKITWWQSQSFWIHAESVQTEDRWAFSDIYLQVTQKDLLPAKRLQALSQQTTDAAARDRYLKAAQKHVREHMAMHGDPRKKMLAIPLVLAGSGAIFMSIFNGVRVLMNSGAHSLTQGGMLWFTDLTSSDPYYGLPILCAAATMGMVKFGMNLGSEEQSAMAGTNAQQAKILRYFLLGASLTFIPAGYLVSAGVAVLWTVNSCYAIVQGLAMRNPRVRMMLGIPTLEEMKRISQEVANANKVSEVNLNVEKSLTDRAAEAERKLGIDGGGRTSQAVLLTQPPRHKKRPKL
ncbi:60Kd inner membrane protein-domain-containing protein [Dunaliella salina]|uniref:60Kd inner membrane protein-domain-containing protein n=1 Tax=Dunaliella salina TaxID=3046 RepID=A0ABQ7H236_DUNSA|nr:60Kd inner membrane protein-domain-containing protein [Dunaliella salina]|eukprot:KAF5840917.1 60Kd inner membrane protein-domain-containing protein [Dunaliella salina]